METHGTRTRRKVQEYIRHYRRDAGKPESLFISRYHQAMTVNGLEQLVKRLGEWAGLTIRVYPHKFRHTFAREFMRNGGDISKDPEIMQRTEGMANYNVLSG